MAKNMVFLHIGPEPVGVTDLHDQLADHRALLAGAGCHLPAVPAAELEFAALEMLREHRSAGVRRRDVEGSWARITRPLWRARRDLVVSQPRFAAADAEQVALVLDHLAGLEVHVVATPTEGASMAFLEPWASVVRPGRLHVHELADGAAVVDLAETLAGVVLTVRRTLFQKGPRRALLRGARRRSLYAA